MNQTHRGVYVALCVALILGLYFTYVGLRYPYLDINVKQNSSGDWLVLKEPGEDTWAQGRVRQGDVLLEIDGRSPDSFNRLVKYHSLDMAEHSLVIEREGREIELLVPAFDTEDTFYTQTLVPFLVFSVLFLLSWRAGRTQGHERDTRLLIAFSLAVGISDVCSAASSRGEFIGFITVRALLVSVPVFLLHFLHVFFARRQSRPYIPSIFIRLGYAVVVFWLILPPLYYWTDVSDIIPYSLYRSGVLITFVVLQVVVLAAVIRNYILSSGPERILHVYILGGLVGAFAPFIFLYALPDAIFGASILSSDIATFSLLIVPLLCFYLLKVKEALDIHFVLYRLRYYGMMALWPSLLIVSVLLLIWHPDEHTHNVIQWIQSFLLIYSVLIAFLYARDFMPERLRNVFFKDSFIQRNRPEQLMHRLSRLMNLKELDQVLVREVESVLNVRSIAILECTEGGYAIKHQQGSLPERGGLQEIALAVRNLAHQDQGSFVPVSAGTCLLYGIQQGQCQVLWFGSKYDQTKLNPDERAWLQTLLNYASLLYVNLQLTENFIGEFERNIASPKQTPTWLLRLLFSISENERKRLSSDLHDSALQDQLLLYRRLESLLAGGGLRQPILGEIEQVRDGMLDVIGQIRETCSELRPPFLKEIGILEAIQHLLGQVRLRTNFSIEFDTTSFHAELDEHQVLTLYRIVQELLQNAGKHAKGATKIKLRLSSTDQAVWLFYRDDGSGMDVGKLKSSFTHMGLWGIQERVASLDGEMQIQSEPGQGLRLQLQIPHTYAAAVS